jgi:multidrug resistance efflux pump
VPLPERANHEAPPAHCCRDRVPVPSRDLPQRRSSGAQETKASKSKKVAAKAAADSEPAKKTPAGKTHTLRRGAFKHEIDVDATLAARQSSEVRVLPEESIQLTIRDVVPHGTRVTKGQTLLKFDTTKIDEQIRDLEAAKALADLSLKSARRDAELLTKTSPLDVELAERGSRQAEEDLARFEKSDREFREKMSGFSVTQYSNFLEYVQEELKQLEKMYKADDLTEETEEIVLKRARNDVDQFKFMVDMAKYENGRTKEVELPRTHTSYKHAAARAALLAEKARLESPASVEKQKLEAEKLEFEQRKAAEHLARLKKDREKLIVTAPADGLVYYGRWVNHKWTGAAEAAQRLRVGMQVQPHDLTLTVIEPGPVEVQAEVPEKDLAHVKVGTAGHFRPKAWPDEKLNVKVETVTSAPQSEGAFGVTFALESASQAPEKLVAGMTGKVKIAAYYKADALTAPPKSVFRDDADDDKRYVFIVDKSGKHERRDVTVGRETEKAIEITSGLSAGDKILLEKPDETDSSTDSTPS